MSTTTTRPSNNTDEAQFLAPETHQRAGEGQEQQEQDEVFEGLRYIPLSNLVKSPLNVRKSESEGSIDELAALIDSQGLLQNLIVIPHVTGKGAVTDKYEVIAGGRRLRALRKLVDMKRLTKHEEILCQLTTREHAVAMSAAENSGREPLNAADTVQAFATMAASGASVEEIAICFGLTPLTVRRRLKLANVSSRLFGLFRAGDMSMEQLMALAIVDDHEAQERVWDGTSDWQRQPHHLRRQLLGQEIDAARDPIARFVGVEAYEAAGGTMLRDLFAEEGDAGYIGDAELLHRLAEAKLTAEGDRLRKAGWKWVEERTSFDYSDRSAFVQLREGMREPTAKEQAKLNALAKESEGANAAMEAFYEDEAAEGSAEAFETRVDAAEQAIDKLRQKMIRWTPEQMNCAGAVVALDHGGRMVVHCGLVKPEDRKQAKAAAVEDLQGGGTKAGGGVEEGEGDESGLKPLSESLCRKLTAHRTKALQVLLADNVQVALAALAHSMIQRVLVEGFTYPTSALSVRAEDCEHALAQFADDLEGSRAFTEMQSRLDAWRERIPGDEDKLLGWLIEQPMDTLQELLALCTALTMNATSPRHGAHEADALAAAVGLDMTEWWTPTAASYLTQVPKARIVEAVTEAVSPAEAEAIAKLKKGEAVTKAEALLAETRWLPAILRSAD